MTVFYIEFVAFIPTVTDESGPNDVPIPTAGGSAIREPITTMNSLSYSCDELPVVRFP